MATNGCNEWHIWPKWCKDNSVVPFVDIAVLYDFLGYLEKVFVSIEKPIFALYKYTHHRVHS